MDLKEIDILGTEIEHHWYYAAKARAMECMLKGTAATKILDVGAGSGFFSRYLLAQTSAQEVWCVDTSYTADSDERQQDKLVHYRLSVEEVNADLALLMDVLEHVDDDVALLKHYVNRVPRGCQFLITVPAFHFLWSAHDDFLEHKRRYTLSQLERTVRDSGLVVKRGAYYFGLVFPIAVTLRLAQKSGWMGGRVGSQLTKHHPLVNGFLRLLCKVELPLMDFNRVAGLTAFCLAESP